VRGGDDRTAELFSYLDLEARVRRNHPLRLIQAIVNGAALTFAAAAYNLVRLEKIVVVPT
jgi:hypothetical protein